MKIAALLTSISLMVGAPLQASCITTPEAQSMALVAMPAIIQQTGIVCAGQLPANSLIHRSSSAFLSRYEVEADRAWPTARAAIVKLSDPAIDILLQSDFARPLLTTLLVPQLVGRIAPEDCGTIDRLVKLLEPLPPRNTAGIIVEALRYLKSEKAKGNNVDVPDLPLCTEPTR